MNPPLPLLVAAGGAIGSLARWYLGTWLQTASGSAFPFGTLGVNVFGSLVIGFLLGIGAADGGIKDGWRLFLVTGVLGGFTTFSAFSAETLLMMRGSEYGPAAVYVAISITFSLVAAGLGLAIGRAIT
jgi:fluoride exporter